MEIHKGINLAMTTVTSIMIVAVCSSGCIEPSRRNLTLEEERQLQRQWENTRSLPREQQDVGRAQVDCNQENLEKKDWNAVDILLDDASDKISRCETFRKATQPDVMKDDRRATESVIDKNLKDALDKLQK